MGEDELKAGALLGKQLRKSALDPVLKDVTVVPFRHSTRLLAWVGGPSSAF